MLAPSRHTRSECSIISTLLLFGRKLIHFKLTKKHITNYFNHRKNMENMSDMLGSELVTLKQEEEEIDPTFHQFVELECTQFTTAGSPQLKNERPSEFKGDYTKIYKRFKCCHANQSTSTATTTCVIPLLVSANQPSADTATTTSVSPPLATANQPSAKTDTTSCVNPLLDPANQPSASTATTTCSDPFLAPANPPSTSTANTTSVNVNQKSSIIQNVPPNIVIPPQRESFTNSLNNILYYMCKERIIHYRALLDNLDADLKKDRGLKLLLQGVLGDNTLVPKSYRENLNKSYREVEDRIAVGENMREIIIRALNRKS